MDWKAEERGRMLACVEQWLDPRQPRIAQRRCAWFILIAPYFAEPPSLRWDLRIVGMALGDPDADFLRVDLEELLTCILPRSMGKPPAWDAVGDRRALRALRTLTSFFEEADWVRVPGLVPQRRFFVRRAAAAAEMQVLARTEQGEVALEVIDTSESGMCASCDESLELREGTHLSEIQIVLGERVIAQGLEGQVLRARSPKGILIHPGGRTEGFRELLATLPPKH